jgi:hypothetical protein
MRRRQTGAVGLLLMLLLVLTLGGLLLAGAGAGLARPPSSSAPLALAAQTLAGHARARHCEAGVGAPVDYLPCPDLGPPEGVAAASCPGTVRGRLPWRTLGLEPLRDAAGECLWYERSASGARVISPGRALAGQTRAGSGAAPVCGGHYVEADYLEASAGNDQSLALSSALLAPAGGCP